MAESPQTVKRSQTVTGANGRDTEPGARRGHRRQREERVLDAAAALLVRWGYRKTTIDDVAREAGVGKGTIYLHWKDKNELFSAAIFRASQHVTEDTLRRLAADPEGGLFHRLWTHGILAILANPLLSNLILGKQEIFQGLIDSLPQETIKQLVGNAEEHIVQLQRAGLIRADLPAPAITFLMGALKIGIISASELTGQDQAIPAEQLVETLSDLIRRWLEPEHLPVDSEVGKRIIADWMEKANEVQIQHR